MTITSYDPRTGQANGTVEEMSSDDVRTVVERACGASSAAAAASPRQRRSWLHAVAAVRGENAGKLVELAELETALGYTRLTSEASRAAGQLRFYGDVAAQGSYLAATVSYPHTPAPRRGIPSAPSATILRRRGCPGFVSRCPDRLPN